MSLHGQWGMFDSEEVQPKVLRCWCGEVATVEDGKRSLCAPHAVEVLKARIKSMERGR